MEESKQKKAVANIIRVSFHDPVDGKTDYFFGSLKAIYSVFTPDQIGCGLGALYFSKITRERKKVTEKCVISKCAVVRAARESGGEGGRTDGKK